MNSKVLKLAASLADLFENNSEMELHEAFALLETIDYKQAVNFIEIFKKYADKKSNTKDKKSRQEKDDRIDDLEKKLRQKIVVSADEKAIQEIFLAIQETSANWTETNREDLIVNLSEFLRKLRPGTVKAIIDKFDPNNPPEKNRYAKVLEKITEGGKTTPHQSDDSNEPESSIKVNDIEKEVNVQKKEKNKTPKNPSKTKDKESTL